MLRDALTLIDTLEDQVAWSFGGGTALAVHLGHRTSYDVDIFMPNADWVTALSPNVNPRTRALLNGRRYQFPGNYLKLQLDGGEVDFIVGGRRTNEPTQQWEFEGRPVPIETPWEIAIKKLFYRPSSFKVRDIFDLAAVLDGYEDKVSASMPIVADKLARAIDRVDAIVPVYEERTPDDVNATAHGQKYAAKPAAEGVLRFLQEQAVRLASPQSKP